MPDGKRSGCLCDEAATGVHLLHGGHLHGLVNRAAGGEQGRGVRQRGSMGPAVPSRKLHGTVEQQVEQKQLIIKVKLLNIINLCCFHLFS